MLGLFLLSLTLLSQDQPRRALAAVPFVLSLCFKQMALYYAPTIFIYLLSLSFPSLFQPNLRLLISLGVAVIVTFALTFLPFLLPDEVLTLIKSQSYYALINPNLWLPNKWDLNTIQQIFHRVFPFGRGLWEDKVANTWCATNILIKWRSLYPSEFLQKLRYDTIIPPNIVFCQPW
jgi:alpha-1,3-glucosyltransferase